VLKQDDAHKRSIGMLYFMITLRDSKLFIRFRKPGPLGQDLYLIFIDKNLLFDDIGIGVSNLCVIT